MTTDVIHELLQTLRQTSAPPDGACQRVTVPIDGIEVTLIRSSSRSYVRAAADEFMAMVDPLVEGSSLGFCRVHSPRRDGKGGWYSIAILEKFPSP